MCSCLFSDCFIDFAVHAYSERSQKCAITSKIWTTQRQQKKCESAAILLNEEMLLFCARLCVLGYSFLFLEGKKQFVDITISHVCWLLLLCVFERYVELIRFIYFVEYIFSLWMNIVLVIHSRKYTILVQSRKHTYTNSSNIKTNRFFTQDTSHRSSFRSRWYFWLKIIWLSHRVLLDL